MSKLSVYESLLQGDVKAC